MLVQYWAMLRMPCHYSWRSEVGYTVQVCLLLRKTAARGDVELACRLHGVHDHPRQLLRDGAVHPSF
jgi:hypothetical protein